MIANGDDEGLGNNNNNNDCDNHHGDSMTIELDHHLVGINDQPLQLFFFTTIAFFLGLVSSHHTALHYKSYSDDDDDSISFPNPLLCISTFKSIFVSVFVSFFDHNWVILSTQSYMWMGWMGLDICQGLF